MKLWLERGEVKSDDPDGVFYVVSLGYDLFSYSIVGRLLAFIQHERFMPEGLWRIATDAEKWAFRKYRNFDIDAVLKADGWKPLEVKQNEKPA